MINYITGDATYPEKVCPNGIKIIVHIVNDIGKWGAGFVLALSRRWSNLKNDYQTHYRAYSLGDIYVSKTSDKNIYVVDLFSQHGIRTAFNPTVIRYDAVEQGLKKLRYRLEKTSLKDVSIHMPKIGSGLAGGNWQIIKNIINKVFDGSNIPIYVYNFK